MATSSVTGGVGNTTLGFTDEDRRLLIDVKAQTDKIPAIQTQVNKLTAIQAQTDKISSIQAQTNTLPAIKAKTDTITAGGLTPAQATQITGIKSQTDKLTGIQSYLVRIDRGVGIRAGDRSVYFVVDALDTLVRHVDTAVVPIKAQTDTLPAIKTQTDKLTDIQAKAVRINLGVGIQPGERSMPFLINAVDTLARSIDTDVVSIKAQTDKLSNVDTKVNEIHQRKALDGAKPVTFKGDGAITSTGMNITAQELGDGSIKQTRQP